MFVDDVVDIGGASQEIEDCNRFLFAGAAVPYAPRADAAEAPQRFEGFHGEWSIETGSFGHYVVFNASERLATIVVDALEAGGLAVQRWDVSHRLASDGQFYDWFARLRFKGSHDEAVSRVSAVLFPVSVDPSVEYPDAPADTRLEDLAARVEELLDLTGELRERLNASEVEVAFLTRRLASVTDSEFKLYGELDTALAHQKSLHDQISELSRSPEQTADTRALLEMQSETEELLELALTENSDLTSSIGALRNQVDHGDAQILTLEAAVVGLKARLEELAEQEAERRRADSVHRAPRRGLLGFLDTAFARLNFVLDGDEVLANVDAPASLLRSLVQIDMGQMVGKDLEGLGGWREVSKLGTGMAGSESMGRIYYKPDGERVLVSVHVKQDDKEQRRHIERLRSLNGGNKRSR
ncbi:hypothetical protein [Arthrobacter sp. zg-Y1171]|uniref:hypothetical protein n=1 Tax=Arthrobacter sp. zg-Y1171 TaxID=2964610 RepID=UPI0021B07458|nr:hypothetical protein [Arthrobacter sp. zg-Y1171]UWX80682.1 hypothetical protein N2L00_09545 [Arthrobacter sp. zg-Y1171]